MRRHSNSSSALSVDSDPPLPVLFAVDPLPEAPPTLPPRYRQIKLALDLHPGDLLMVRRVDGAKLLPPQKRSYDNFLRWVVTEVASKGWRQIWAKHINTKPIKVKPVITWTRSNETFKREAVNNWLASGKSAEVVAEELELKTERLYA